jgi:hypothetical protein
MWNDVVASIARTAATATARSGRERGIGDLLP